tara:strand:+ start:74 stop:289 length:216 start_codon:yes stop_codon:yes gene_type:complete
MKNYYQTQLNKIFEEDWSSLSQNTKLNRLNNWDSLKQIELVGLIEKKIKKKLSINQILRIKSVKDVNIKLK